VRASDLSWTGSVLLVAFSALTLSLRRLERPAEKSPPVLFRKELPNKTSMAAS